MTEHEVSLRSLENGHKNHCENEDQHQAGDRNQQQLASCPMLCRKALTVLSRGCSCCHSRSTRKTRNTLTAISGLLPPVCPELRAIPGAHRFRLQPATGARLPAAGKQPRFRFQPARRNRGSGCNPVPTRFWKVATSAVLLKTPYTKSYTTNRL